ncbi:MAG: sigma 54-interacting transcriptional regulator [Planctomycetes bacterium]|nr:sigma 54-interacting transcriptional regulator [Planctomycetota bacterium]
MGAPLLVIRDAEGERAVPLLDEVTTVGRSRTNRLRIEAEGVSRCHCQLVEAGGRWRVVDLQSHNGTRVNGARVEEKVLEEGDTIEVGRAQLLFCAVLPEALAARSRQETQPVSPAVAGHLPAADGGEGRTGSGGEGTGLISAQAGQASEGGGATPGRPSPAPASADLPPIVAAITAPAGPPVAPAKPAPPPEPAAAAPAPNSMPMPHSPAPAPPAPPLPPPPPVVRPRLPAVSAPVAVAEVRGGDPRLAVFAGEPARALRYVEVLLEIIQAGSSGESLTALTLLTLDRVLEVTDTERGMLLLDDEGGTRLSAARDRMGRTLEAFQDVSQSLLRQVREAGTGAFRMEAGQDPAEGRTTSMEQFQLRAALCVPLRAADRTLGLLYVDSHGASRRFTGDDLRFLEAVARHVGVVLDNFRFAERRERSHDSNRRRLEAENAALRDSLGRRAQVLGESEGMKAVYETVRKVAPTDATCLVLGESGTGKEALAHALHTLSPRASAPLVIVDCGSIPETLIESELFGHEKGAFTGAVARRIGKFEEADRGTLFLDEVGELPLQMQVKLLRVLQEREFTRVGGLERIRVDVRFVAATNADLEAAVRTERFRADLYHRLCVVQVKLPPLRERDRDCLLLAHSFLQRFSLEHGRPVRGFSAEALEAMLRHPWPGNVRELEHRVEQAVILSEREMLTPEDLKLRSDLPLAPTLEIARDRFEAEYVKGALARNAGNVTHTARALGISRQHLQTLMKKHGLERGGN